MCDELMPESEMTLYLQLMRESMSGFPVSIRWKTVSFMEKYPLIYLEISAQLNFFIKCCI